jgi:hypothetical protein
MSAPKATLSIMTNSIVAEGLTKRFGPVTAVDGIDLTVKEGTVFGLLGPNGAGKTTTVHILATLVTPDAGHATIAGYDVQTQAHQVRQLIGLAGQYASASRSVAAAEAGSPAASSARPCPARRSNRNTSTWSRSTASWYPPGRDPTTPSGNARRSRETRACKALAAPSGGCDSHRSGRGTRPANRQPAPLGQHWPLTFAKAAENAT